MILITVLSTSVCFKVLVESIRLVFTVRTWTFQDRGLFRRLRSGLDLSLCILYCEGLSLQLYLFSDVTEYIDLKSFC